MFAVAPLSFGALATKVLVTFLDLYIKLMVNGVYWITCPACDAQNVMTSCLAIKSPVCELA